MTDGSFVKTNRPRVCPTNDPVGSMICFILLWCVTQAADGPNQVIIAIFTWHESAQGLFTYDVSDQNEGQMLTFSDKGGSTVGHDPLATSIYGIGIIKIGGCKEFVCAILVHIPILQNNSSMGGGAPNDFKFGMELVH